MSRIVVLLPPSEGKAAGGRSVAWDPGSGRFGELARAREAVVRGLGDPRFDPGRELGVRGAALAAACAANDGLVGARTLPALRRYTGVLYEALAYSSLPVGLRRRLDRQVLIISGLLGVVAGGDPVPDYKLPIGAAVPGAGRLGPYWRSHLDSIIRQASRGAVVWDLLPGAHASAVPKQLGVVRWRVRVQRDSGGLRTTVSHDNKAVKGALVRAIVAGGHTDPAELADWRGPGGYRLLPPSENHHSTDSVVDVVAYT